MRLRIMTYNIRSGRGLDNRVDLDRIADVIGAFEPDIVALQEVDVGRARSGSVDQASYLARRLAMTASFAPCIVRGDDRYGIATLTRLPVLATRQLTLPQQTHRRRSEPRCALMSRLTWAGAGRELDVINTHLSILPGERPAQVAMIASEAPADDLVICGDFNCTPWSRSFRVLCCGLKSATGASRSWPSRLPLFPLDHILYRGPLSVIRAGTWTAGAAKRASDHLPVIAELQRELEEVAA
ncbi:MAG: endonuclease/exonuclease/phosphatase family protein [Deltaproteobacteria bacterium]|nr:endonuclease/exonuclease/phosphatase family protein [Deltaproteobacteria bacterium]MDQ3299284.1 endonuclease/exonuclease/phosphatase family protein [Myxococcota bacterium]